MANLIDKTYFIGEITLPGKVLDGTYADITQFITRYEKEALIDLLGYTLYKALKAEIDSVPQTFTTKWSRLVNGYEYTEDYLGDEHTVRWNGLVNTDKVSLLAYYIYYKYVYHHVTHTSSIGEVIASAENANRISVADRLVNAWNRYIELRGHWADHLINPTAYNFLKKYEDDQTNSYDKWLFMGLNRTNTFGI